MNTEAIVKQIESDSSLQFAVVPHGFPNHMVRLFDGSYLQELHISDAAGNLQYRVVKSLICHAPTRKGNVLKPDQFARIQEAHARKTAMST